MGELLQTADAALAAGVTPSAIHRAVQDGRLRVTAATRRGTRLFQPSRCGGIPKEPQGGSGQTGGCDGREQYGGVGDDCAAR